MVRLALTASLVLFTALLVAPPAGGAFAGANGKIAYDRSTTGERLSIFTIDPDGTNRTRLTPNDQNAADPAWSPDGQQIAFSFGGGRRLRVMDPDGSNVSTVLKRADLPGGVKRYGGIADPAWSPDGTALAFSALHHTLGWRVFTVGTDGTGLTKLSSGDHISDLSPAWSPDGTTIAVDSYGDIVLLAADGSTRETLLIGDYARGPDWSPTGAQLAFSQLDSTDGLPLSNIFTINADGSGLARVTDTPEHSEMEPAWSPDGTRIVYSRNKGPGAIVATDLWTISPDGSSPERITDTKWYERSPNWQPV